jgi:hypothetical protein
LREELNLFWAIKSIEIIIDTKVIRLHLRYRRSWDISLMVSFILFNSFTNYIFAQERNKKMTLINHLINSSKIEKILLDFTMMIMYKESRDSTIMVHHFLAILAFYHCIVSFNRFK